MDKFLTAEQLSFVKAMTLAKYPHEAVFLLTDSGIDCVNNIAEDPTKDFRVHKCIMGKAYKNGLKAIIHSHPDFPCCPSAADMRGQIDSRVPWGILSTDGKSCTDIAWWGDQVEPLPLLDRSFRHGITDCYSLIRDYYRLEVGIFLPEFPRDWEWWLADQDLYQDGFEKAGFRVIDSSEAKPGDVWLAQLKSPVVNHGGILLDHGLILHHPSARKPVDSSQCARREPGARWMNHIMLWLRHESR